LRRWLTRRWVQAPAGRGYHRRRADAVVAAAGLAIAALCAVLVASTVLAGADAGVFRWADHWPGWLYPPMWVVQLAGVIGAFGVLAALAALLGMLRLAVALGAAALLKVSGEDFVKIFVHRYRPGQTISDAIVRHGAAAHGLSFPSGHAMVTCGIAALVTPYLTGRWKILPWALAAAVCLSRIYLGAHFPLDVMAGAGLGLFIGAALNLVFGVPRGRPLPGTPALGGGSGLPGLARRDR
jgi:membrane-associated phospholipid phosphatase